MRVGESRAGSTSLLDTRFRYGVARMDTATEARKERVHRIIFESDTPAGRTFDVALLLCIALGVLVVMLDSVPRYHAQYGSVIATVEWVLTALFTLEYAVRLWCLRRPVAYAMSFYGVVDLLSIVPTYLSLFVTGFQALLVIRSLRLLRVFRIFELGELLGEATVLSSALRASRPKILVFLGTVLISAMIIGSLMFLIEGPEHGFTNIPRSVYWAVVTITTVGYGDIHPQTALGQMLAALAMILGYGIIAVPTGIVSAQLAKAGHKPVSQQACPSCASEAHDFDAVFCKRCGTKL